MVKKTTKELADDILSDIQFAINAHIHHPKSSDDAVRFWDRTTPYIVHPTWCAMTILTETTLDDHIRLNGSRALLWHDILEDTTISNLPAGTPDTVLSYVQDMTFNSFAEELDIIWSRDKEIRLLKLYDKVSNLLDGTWMKDKKWNDYIDFTLNLARDVETNYGLLNIVKISTTIAVKKS